MRPVAQDLLAEPRSFVFRDGYLVDHNGGAGFLLPLPVNHLTAWDSLVASLANIVDGAAEAMTLLEAQGEAFRLTDTLGGDRLTLVGLRDADCIRITLAAADAKQSTVRIDQGTLDGFHREISNLRRASETNPALSWCLDAEDRIIWANGAYRAKLLEIKGGEAGHIWPIPALFPDECSLTPGTLRRKLSRAEHNDQPGGGNWYELCVSKIEQGERFVHATPLDRVVKAEDTLRNFIQTLTKTFAHLPTGLAIFDRDRQLALFNPALIDLTGLDGAWLSQRPTLQSFFDHLRDMQRIPEPKNYCEWRESLTQLERASESGTYEETWTLASGQTFRVTGRPHTDGAVALLIEDISAELAITRRFRSELEVFQSVLDTTDEGMVVLSNAGHVTLSNAAYAALWNSDPRYTVATPSAAEAIGIWQDACEPTPLWSEIREFLARIDDRAEWFEDIRLTSGQAIQVRVTPLPGGMTLIGFATKSKADKANGSAPLIPANSDQSSHRSHRKHIG